MRRFLQLASGVSVHLLLFIVVALVLAAPRPVRAPDVAATPLIWTAPPPQPGQPDGGGHGGNRIRASPSPPVEPAAEPIPRFVLPRMPDVLAALELPGVQVAFAAPSAAGPGAGTGPAGGMGEGAAGPGSGLGAGAGAGTGDRPFADGSPGLTSPLLVFEKRPDYTAEAMSARVQGTVLIEAVVREDGSVGPARVIRAMHPSFGLEQKALEAVRAWRFRPGTYQGRAVAVTVLVELLFTLR